MKNIIQQSFQREGFSLNEQQIEQFVQYYDLLIDWNKKINLTAIEEPQEVADKHFVDSALLLSVKKDLAGCSLIDIGTGAGFPGIPLKIIEPNLKLTLFDSLNKRINFLNTVIDELGLMDMKTIHGRAEDYAKQAEYREQFDLCVSRAVANLSTLSEYCIPYVKIGGLFIPYKSGEIDEEVQEAKKAISTLGGKLEQVIKFQLPNTEINRSFVKIIKLQNTAKKYPRKAGMPTKEPIV